MRSHARRFTRIGAALLALLVGACATNRYPPGDATLLTFLAEGSTTREETMLRLGQPSATYQSERILTYRLGYQKDSGYFVVTPSALNQWMEVRYSLVLVFDEGGKLLKHSLVPVQ